MTGLVLRIYDYMRSHKWVCFGSLGVVTMVMALLLLRLDYKEDISDFLPMDRENAMAMSVYQDISGANRIYAIVSLRDTSLNDPDRLVTGVDAFTEMVQQSDSTGAISSIMSQVDMEQMLGIAEQVYRNIPYFLTENDYARIDSLLESPGYMEQALQNDREMLLFPSSGVLAANLSRDPLQLFSPVTSRLSSGGMDIDFDTYDCYILSPDGKRAVVMMESAFGAHESDHNAKLAQMLSECVTKVAEQDEQIDVHIIGGPVIAVANAERIKKDSILAVALAGILIVILLIYVFRNLRNILLILVSVAWGWLFAMACIALYYNSVSIIVIGIASVILGIAVNYPLHLIDHIRESPNMRSALREIVAPLVIGNVTTVGAFLCLVPLKAPALHDLGLFSSLLLIGTILFVLIFLPQMVKVRRVGQKIHEPKLITRLAKLKLENNRYVVIAVVVMTVVFGYFSLRTEFDTDMRHINYMTREQHEDMDYFTRILAKAADTEKYYVVSNGSNWDEALQQNSLIELAIDSLQRDGVIKKRNHLSDFLVSSEEYSQRLERWHEFVSKYSSVLSDDLHQAAQRTGFSQAAFSEFDDILNGEYGEMSFENLDWLAKSVFSGNLSVDAQDGRYSVVQVLDILPQDAVKVKQIVDNQREFGGFSFDVRSMNGAMANTLSDDFNYIGIACGLIVFFFLWISFGSIELAIISFLPMAVSWIWILGIMGMLGMKFNIVNIILATFIFGQGDDYTIFITEGLCYELAYRKKMLESYKNSIIVSALIMFIGIGTLIFAQHPAMRSLGEVTVVGMISVVLMAYILPPLAFRWLTMKNGKLRRHPITLKLICEEMCHKIFRTKKREDRFNEAVDLVFGRYLYKGRDIEREGRKQRKMALKQREQLLNLNYDTLEDEIGVSDTEIVIKKDNMCVSDTEIVIKNDDTLGFLPLLLAILYPQKHISVIESNEMVAQFVEGSAHDLVSNLSVHPA